MANAGPRNKASDIRGVGRLAVNAALGLADLVETMHHNIVRARGPLGRVERAPMGGVPGLVYRSIRGVTRLVGGGIDRLLGQLAPLLAHEPSSARREALLAALNGVLGDHLAASANPLAIPMRLRRDGVALELSPAALRAAFPATPRRVVVLVHGLCLNDRQWRRAGHDHGAALERDAGGQLAALYLHYNTGCHVSTSGRAFADILETLVGAWPVELEEIVILAHSMGGLVARSACVHGAGASQRWPRLLRTMVFLGTPHSGAPLERGGNWVDRVLDASPYTAAFARLGKLRSAGITDLRHGSLLDEDWVGRDRFGHSPDAHAARTPVALPEGVACHAIAGSLGRRAGALHGRLLGDGLVPLASALGTTAGPDGAPLFPPERQWIARRTGHLGLLASKRVYKIIGVRLQLSLIRRFQGENCAINLIGV